jgi:aminoglycoside phosphotransferase
MAHDEAFRADMPRLVRLIAAGMRQIHSISIEDCPFDQRLDTRIEAARVRMINGLVDEDDFDPQRRGRSAEELYPGLLADRPRTEALVFTHGDYCLPNIIIDPANRVISGFIDWGSAGIADRHQDIALAARSLEYNFGAEWVPLLFEEYGIELIDPAKIEYYKLLDEFF